MISPRMLGPAQSDESSLAHRSPERNALLGTACSARVEEGLTSAHLRSAGCAAAASPREGPSNAARFSCLDHRQRWALRHRAHLEWANMAQLTVGGSGHA